MGNVAHMGIRKLHTEIWRRNMKERKHLQELCIDGRVILKWILKEIG